MNERSSKFTNCVLFFKKNCFFSIDFFLIEKCEQSGMHECMDDYQLMTYQVWLSHAV